MRVILTIIVLGCFSLFSEDHDQRLLAKMTKLENLGSIEKIDVLKIQAVGAKTTLNREVWVFNYSNGDVVSYGLNSYLYGDSRFEKDGTILEDGAHYPSLHKDLRSLNSYRYGCVQSGYGSPSIPFYSEGSSAPESCSKEDYDLDIVYNDGRLSGTFKSYSGWFDHRTKEGRLNVITIKSIDMNELIIKKYVGKLLLNAEKSQFFFIDSLNNLDDINIRLADSNEIVSVTSEFLRSSKFVAPKIIVKNKYNVSSLLNAEFVCHDYSTDEESHYKYQDYDAEYRKVFKYRLSSDKFQSVKIIETKKRKITDTPFSKVARLELDTSNKIKFASKTWNNSLYVKEGKIALYLYNGESSVGINFIGQTEDKKAYFTVADHYRVKFCVEIK